MGGYQNKQVVTYKNMDELAQLIQSCSFRVTKEECLDLPPKMPPVRRDVQMAPKQKQEYVRMKKEFLALVDEVCPTCDGAGYLWMGGCSEFPDGYSEACHTCGGSRCAVHATIALTQLLRLQQIASGFIMDGEKLLHWFTDKPPKIMETCDLLEECGDQQIILWSNHKPEIHRLVQELAIRSYSYVEYHGDIRPEVREQNRVAFQKGDFQYVVGHPAAGGIGVDLWAASGAAYLSNSFKTEDRVQSEDRCHRIGSEIHDSVNYWDIVVPGTVDVTILRVIRNNRSVSDEIMAGGLRRLLHESETA
jgi:SNF2 family DNA or RNA helicase